MTNVREGHPPPRSSGGTSSHRRAQFCGVNVPRTTGCHPLTFYGLGRLHHAACLPVCGERSFQTILTVRVRLRFCTERTRALWG